MLDYFKTNNKNNNINDKVELEKDPTVYYTIGLTDDNRISFTLGHGVYCKTIFMNEIGVRGLIKMLESSMELLYNETSSDEKVEEEDNEDGC